MKAIQYTGFGDSGVIRFVETEQPVPKEDEILIKTAAASINHMDMKIRSGALQERMPVTLPYIPGIDIAGTVEAMGGHVARFKIGDKVFATMFGGTYAAYAVVKENQAEVVPINIDLHEAAALATPLVTAYTFLVEEGKVNGAQKILIHGASGGVGNVVVQMAKALGAYVIGSASTQGVDLVRSYGADEVIDYKTQDFTKLVKNVDLVIDLVGGDTQTKSFKVIKRGGKLLSAGMSLSTELAKQCQVTAKFVSATPSFKKLAFGKELVEAGKIKANIVKTLQLSEAAEAQDLVSAGGINGKVILEVN